MNTGILEVRIQWREYCYNIVVFDYINGNLSNNVIIRN